MNSVLIMGRISQELELKTTQSGISVCAFNVAVKRPHVKDVTDFIPCVAWRQTAEFITHYFGKGEMIAIIGQLTTRKYEDKNGNKRTAYEVLIDTVEFCGEHRSETPTTAQDEQKTDEQGNTPPSTYEAQDAKFEDIDDDDDLPF